MKKTIFTIMLIVTITINSVGVNGIVENKFSDIPSSHWAIEYINQLVSLGIINGFPNGTFKPNDNINVDAYIKMVVTALGYTSIKNGSPYWAQNYIDKALDLNLIQEGQFDTYKRIITREEMASIVMRGLGYVQETKNIEKDFLFIKYSISDFDNISEKYVQEVVESYNYGIITGKPNGFDPQGNATRAEAVTVVLRLLDESYRKSIFIPPTVAMDEIKKDENDQMYFDIYRYQNYKNSDNEKEMLARVYECTDGEPSAIEVMYAMDKVYQDNEGYVYISRLVKPEHPIGVSYSCVDDISKTIDDVIMIDNTEVRFSIKHSKHDTGSSYSISLYYKTHDMTYMERYYKYQKLFDTILMYLYENNYQLAKDNVTEILKLGENMGVDKYNYTIKMNNREMYVEINQNHSIRFKISKKGGKIDHYYPIVENKPKAVD